MSTQAQRKMAARQAALTRWSRTPDRVAALAPARRGTLERFEREVDPHGELNSATRLRLAEAARKAHMTRLALASSKARAAARARRSA